MINRSLLLGLLLFLTVLVAPADEDTWNKVGRSFSRFGDTVRNTFTEDASGRPSPTPRRHRRSSTRHSSSNNPKVKPSPSPAEKSDSTDDVSAATKPSPEPSAAEEGDSAAENNPEKDAPMATLKPEELREFATQPPQVQQVIGNSLALTEQNLGYKYGSADPAAGGMDCSGFIFYVLNNAGYKDVPRDSSGQYVWVRKNSDFHAVLSRSGESFELDDLKPGDLMFWSGTYKVDRDIPISHVMIYLGKEKSTGKPVMVGATDGRSYNGIRRFGVSVFDFKMPSGKPNNNDPALTSRFEGYASIPGMRPSEVAAKEQDNPEQGIKSEKAPPTPKQKTRPSNDGD
jgi:peptidoglycan DL-endopeptidase CwlO